MTGTPTGMSKEELGPELTGGRGCGVPVDLSGRWP
jgi:hypothetical protein